MCTAAKSCVEAPSMSDYLWAGVLTILLLVYLLYAMLKPEKF